MGLIGFVAVAVVVFLVVAVSIVVVHPKGHDMACYLHTWLLSIIL